MDLMARFAMTRNVFAEENSTKRGDIYVSYAVRNYN